MVLSFESSLENNAPGGVGRAAARWRPPLMPRQRRRPSRSPRPRPQARSHRSPLYNFFPVYLLGFRIQYSGFMMISRVCRLETSLYPRPSFLNKIIYRRRPWPRGGRLPAASAPALPCPPVSPRRAPVTDGCPQRPPPLLRSPPRHLPSRMNALSMLQPSQVLNCQNNGVASA